MSKQSLQTKTFYGLAVVALMVLSGCDWCCKKKSCATSVSGASVPDSNDKSAVLLTIDGKPVVTEVNSMRITPSSWHQILVCKA